MYDFIKKCGHKSIFFGKKEEKEKGENVPSIMLIKAKANYFDQETGFYVDEAIVDVSRHRAIKAVLNWGDYNAYRRKTGNSVHKNNGVIDDEYLQKVEDSGVKID